MTKARFTAEQPAVTVKEFEDVTYVYICLNGEEKQETIDRVKEVYWEYDYNEIVFGTGELDIEDIKANPEKYLDYYVGDAPTEMEQMRADIDYLLMVTEG